MSNFLAPASVVSGLTVGGVASILGIKKASSKESSKSPILIIEPNYVAIRLRCGDIPVIKTHEIKIFGKVIRKANPRAGEVKMHRGIMFQIPIRHKTFRIYEKPAEQEWRDQGVVTKDNLFFFVMARVILQISDPVQAIFNLADYKAILAGNYQAALIHEFAQHNSDDLDLTRICEAVKERAEEKARPYGGIGVEVLSFDITAIDSPPHTEEAMAVSARASKAKKALAETNGLPSAVQAAIVGRANTVVTVDPARRLASRTIVRAADSVDGDGHVHSVDRSSMVARETAAANGTH